MNLIEHPEGATDAIIKDVLRQLTDLGIYADWRHGERFEGGIYKLAHDLLDGYSKGFAAGLVH